MELSTNVSSVCCQHQVPFDISIALLPFKRSTVNAFVEKVSEPFASRKYILKRYPSQSGSKLHQYKRRKLQRVDIKMNCFSSASQMMGFASNIHGYEMILLESHKSSMN